MSYGDGLVSVIKRDGKSVPFDSQKIYKAILKAGKATGEYTANEATNLTNQVLKILDIRYVNTSPDVETIQDVVEHTLVSNNYFTTFRQYSVYRDNRTRIRKDKVTTIDAIQSINEYLRQDDWRVKANANQGYSLGGMILNTSGKITANYWLSHVYPQEIGSAHRNGDIHIHDLDMLSGYTYFGKETTIVKTSDGTVLNTSFEMLYDNCPEEEVLLNKEDEAYAKFPKDLYVLDKENWVQVTQLTKKKKHRQMKHLRSVTGHDIIVTDNHPIITENGEVEAQAVNCHNTFKWYEPNMKTLLENQVPELFKCKKIDLLAELIKRKIYVSENDHPIIHNNKAISEYKEVPPVKNIKEQIRTSIYVFPRILNLNSDFGYYVGRCVVEGHLFYSFRYSPNNWFLQFLFNEVFKTYDFSSLGFFKNASLPTTYLQYNLDFALGMIGALIDHTGKVDVDTGEIQIKTCSRFLCGQVNTLLRSLGIVPNVTTTQSEMDFCYYRISFVKNSLLIPSVKLCIGRTLVSKVNDLNTWNSILPCTDMEIEDENIYDITTTSSTLLVNDIWSHNCAGWSLRVLLNEGLNGVPGKVEADPPKHFSSAVGQIVNFLGILQNEWAGAQAFSSFDTYMAPFIRVDNMKYEDVKQNIQELIYNLNASSRWGSQCVDGKTEILTVNGWAKYDQVNVGDEIYAFDIRDNTIRKNNILRMYVNEKYDGSMYHLRGKEIDKLVTPKHRIVRREFASDHQCLIESIEDTFDHRVAIDIPTSGILHRDTELPMSDDEIRWMAWIIWSLSDMPRNETSTEHIQEILKSRDPNNIFNFQNDVSKELIQRWFIGHASVRQMRVFLNEIMGAASLSTDFNFEDENSANYALLQELIVLSGYRTTNESDNSKESLTIDNCKEYMATVSAIDFIARYTGVVWCPTVELGTFICRRNGKVFITGNCPFTNLTFDWTCPKDLKDKHPLIGGKEMDFTYGDLQVEMDMINKAYIEVMTKGDRRNRVFTFPIPTYNITEDFPWESSNTDLLFEMTAKYGIPYFQNFLNSDLEPHMVRSMCPLPGSTPVVIRTQYHQEQAVIRTIPIIEVLDYVANGYAVQVWTGKHWAYGKPNKVPMTEVLCFELNDGSLEYMGINHLQLTKDHGTLPAKDIQLGMEFPYIQKSRYEIFNDTLDSKVYHKTVLQINQMGKFPEEFLYCFEVDDPSATFMLGSGLLTHNCRLQLDLRELLKRGNGLFGSGENTGSIGVCTINCARLGHLHKKDYSGLIAKLDHLLEICKNSLELKRKTIQMHMDNGLFPYTSRYLGTLRNHFSTIGVNGINELIRNFTDDKENITTTRGYNLAIDIMDRIREKMTQFQEETGHMYNLEATPKLQWAAV